MEGKSLDYFPSTKANSNDAYLNKTIEQRSSQDNVDYPSIASSIVTGLFFNAYLNRKIEQMSSHDNIGYPSIASSIVTGLFFDAYLKRHIEPCYEVCFFFFHRQIVLYKRYKGMLSDSEKLFLYNNGYNFNNTKVMLDDLVFTAHYLQTWIQNYVLQFLPFTS